MTLLWPFSLALLALIPLLILLYIFVLRRRKRLALRYSSLALVRTALPERSNLRRYVPLVLFLLGLASLAVALARPMTIIAVPTDRTTIMLVIDVSMSMRQRDIPPSRLDAAKEAALNFVQKQKAGTQIGLVAFAGFAELIQSPTTDAEQLQAAILSLTTGRRTAIGSGILQGIDAIAEIDPNVAPSTPEGSTGSGPTPVPQGAYAPDIIVLLTDGVSNSGPDPMDAAQQAVDRGLRVYTIGFGTAQGSPISDFPQFFGGNGPGTSGRGFGGDPSGGGQFGGNFGGFRRGIDEETLKKVSNLTGGKYYSASSAEELNSVFNSLPTNLIMRHETNEISFAFVLGAALLVGAAVVLSQLWQPLP